MVRISTILTQVLRPRGFTRKGMSWLRYRNRMLTRVSFYSSQFGGNGYLDVTLTISDVPIERQRIGDWEALERIYGMIPSGPRIEDFMKKELTDEEAEVLQVVMEKEAVPLLEKLSEPVNAKEIVRSGKWLTRTNFLEKLDRLIVESSTNEARK